MSDWILRQAKPADAAGLSACVQSAYRHYIPRMGKPPGPMIANYSTEIDQHQVWVVEDSGQIIAGLILIPAAAYLLLDNIAVHPNHQSRGIGRALLALADREAATQDYAELRLYTHETMTENIAMYTYLGWIETGRGEQDGYQRVFMRKPLTSKAT